MDTEESSAYLKLGNRSHSKSMSKEEINEYYSLWSNEYEKVGTILMGNARGLL
jgi:hypothetical protein